MSTDDQSYCIARYPKRTYTRTSTLPGGNWGIPDLQADNPSVSMFPAWTHYLPYDEGHHCECSLHTLHNMGGDKALTNDGGDGGKALWKGCGYCPGGKAYDCCGCCIQQWADANKIDCCDPSGNSKQDSSIYCAPSWCPFSPSCLSDASHDMVNLYKDYCLAHLGSKDCLNACMNYNNATDHQKAPPWCPAFMAAYCHLKTSAGEDSMNVTDKTLCACQKHMTGVDECLWPDCVNAASGTAWMSDKQWENQRQPTFCTNTCKSMVPAVMEQKGAINASIFQQVCPQVPLPVAPSGKTASDTPGSSTDASGSPSPSFVSRMKDNVSNFWGNTVQWAQTRPWWVWVAVGGVCFLLLVLLFARRSPSPGKATRAGYYPPPPPPGSPPPGSPPPGSPPTGSPPPGSPPVA